MTWVFHSVNLGVWWHKLLEEYLFLQLLEWATKLQGINTSRATRLHDVGATRLHKTHGDKSAVWTATRLFTRHAVEPSGSSLVLRRRQLLSRWQRVNRSPRRAWAVRPAIPPHSEPNPLLDPVNRSRRTRGQSMATHCIAHTVDPPVGRCTEGRRSFCDRDLLFSNARVACSRSDLLLRPTNTLREERATRRRLET